MAFVQILGAPVRVRRGPRMCSAEEKPAESSESKKEARERAAREREERIRAKRRERQDMLDRAEGVVRVKDVRPEETDEGMVMPKGNYGDNASGVFGWVNRNPSSKNAVYMESFKGDGGNTGEMAKRIRGRGKTNEGFEITVNCPKTDLTIYVRKVGSQKSNLAPIVLVHGILAHSWCYKEVLAELEKNDREAYAFDFPGSGYSSWPQPGIGFSFTEESMVDVVDRIMDKLALKSRGVILVTQGYVFCQYANLWAVQNPNDVANLVLLNQPLQQNSKLPFYLQQYKIPLVAPFVAQDSMRAERFLEAGGPYVMSLSDSDRYREPFLESMMPGLALIDSVSKIKFGSVMQRLVEGLSDQKDKVSVVWGTSDKYIKIQEAEDFIKNTGAKLHKIDNAGFLVQSDWPQRVADYLRGL
eukprot:Plantae.Rhodophyta-Purpureofilum_apyrenoidigerum.ctg8215.p1 GENE.Plantae.Rhodophyta-Purpureofilum_apyrenoidigerum.ctg8215~~Plantae.Rhodophyta-Purpureofilum_apyrenoidigerum.ctg8215.p1  ORF type:complete len:414 (+),score=58.95 Plantae.Rhodophyta-Purpureofilum_apyrenoidigerum.ctg8215:113-1354(+)